MCSGPNVFQKLLAKYHAGKAQYQHLKKELEKLSGKPRTLCSETLILHFPLSRSHSKMLPRSSLRLSPS
jgi:hypothetical protein